MPAGPSHSRSSSGGFSSGSSSHSSGGFGSRGPSHRDDGRHNGGFEPHPHISGPRPPMFPRNIMIFGRPVVVTSRTKSIFTFLSSIVLFFVMVCIVLGISVSDVSKDITEVNQFAEIVLEDAEFYNNLIRESQKNIADDNYYIVNATFNKREISYYIEDNPQSGYYYYLDYKGTKYFYIVYEYENPITHETMCGETYAMYTSSQISSFNGSLELAVTKDGNSWWSIPTDYKLSNNIEYNDAVDYLNEQKTHKQTLVISLVVCGLVTVALVVVTGLVLNREIKKAQKEAEIEQIKAEAEASVAQAKAEVAQKEAKSKSRVCSYCGNIVPDGAEKCPSCGSRKYN